MTERPVSFVVVGHVDHGKSSLIGRLLYETDSVRPDLVENVRQLCEERGKPFEYAFLLDAFQEEREQGITIDTTKIEFSTPKRRYTIIDAPGHKEFLKNMASGASRAEAALLILDAEEGVREQTRRHAYLLSLLGIDQVNVVVNKMDLVEYSEKRFGELTAEIISYLRRIGIAPKHIVPISAREGDNMVERSENMPWYSGPTIISMLDTFELESDLERKPLRFPLQDVYKFDERRILAGRIEAGSLKAGDRVTFYPSRKQATVLTFEDWPEAGPQECSAGRSVGITIDDEFYLKRGEVLTTGARPHVSTLLQATVFWMGKNPLVMGRDYLLKLNTQRVSCRVHAIDSVIDAQTLEPTTNPGELQNHNVGKVVLKTREPVAFDAFTDSPTTGRFVIVDGYDVTGGGILAEPAQIIEERPVVESRSMLISPKEGLVSRKDRELRKGHRGAVVWLTGLAGCGKEDIAQEMEQALFEAGIDAYYLDSTNVRMTLSSDLSFSEKQRHEHSRRVAELANYLMDAGHVVVVSIISPYSDDREYARSIIGDSFHEIFVDAPLELCKKRNPHGIYTKFEQGDIRGIPGLDLQYERGTGKVLSVDERSDPRIIGRSLAEEIARAVR